jgi:hypothetical protein
MRRDGNFLVNRFLSGVLRRFLLDTILYRNAGPAAQIAPRGDRSRMPALREAEGDLRLPLGVGAE